MWKETNSWSVQKKYRKENWWKGKGDFKNKSVIFVPATPRSELYKMFQEIKKEQRKENKNLMNFQLIEQTGLSLETLFKKSNPFREEDCGKSDCRVSHTNGVKCRSGGVGYRGMCRE